MKTFLEKIILSLKMLFSLFLYTQFFIIIFFFHNTSYSGPRGKEQKPKFLPAPLASTKTEFLRSQKNLAVKTFQNSFSCHSWDYCQTYVLLSTSSSREENK